MIGPISSLVWPAQSRGFGGLDAGTVRNLKRSAKIASDCPIKIAVNQFVDLRKPLHSNGKRSMGTRSGGREASKPSQRCWIVLSGHLSQQSHSLAYRRSASKQVAALVCGQTGEKFAKSRIS